MPTPADLANWVAGRRAITSPTSAERLLRSSFPGVVVTVEQVGCAISGALEEWTLQAGADSVATWINAGAPDRAIASEWTRSSSAVNMLAALVQEQQICQRGSAIGAYLKSNGSSFSAAIQLARRRAGLAIVQHANSIPFYRPVVLSRATELAIDYLRSVVGIAADRSPGLEDRRAIRELGKAIVTLARFTLVSDEEMNLASGYLLDAISDVGATEVTRAIYLEACLHQYHQGGSRVPLSSAVEMIRSSSIPDNDWGAWHLSSAEVWLALADTADTGSGRKEFLSRARVAMDRSLGLNLELTYEIKRAMLNAFLTFREELSIEKDAIFRGLRFPFGLRTRVEAMPDAFFRASKDLTNALKSPANRGQYAYRDALSEMYSYLARNGESNRDRVRWMVGEAIRLRGPVGRKDALAGMRSNVAQAEDCFLLAKLDKTKRHLRGYGTEILQEEMTRDSSPEPLILLAREVEQSGPIPELVGRGEVAECVRVGNHRRLYALAAERAVASPDMLRKGLGGRGGIVTVEDYSGVTGQTFVFKKMTVSAHARDSERATSILGNVDKYELRDRFGVIEQLTIVPVDSRNLVSVRRFTDGLPLRRALELEPSTGHRGLLNSIDFLAFYHATEEQNPSFNWRKEVQAKEVGRWLRHVMPSDERTVAVGKLSELMLDVPLFRRRDAHTLNWLVGEGGRIFAVDLDATGWRPLGYELAQLTDDYPIFEPENLRRRRELVNHYLERLKIYGVEVDIATGHRAYFASLAARAARSLGDPLAGDVGRMHAFRLLQRIASDEGLGAAASWAAGIRDAWARKAGLVDGAQTTAITDRQRKRISRAMAFHLRHDQDAPLSREGWIFADDLAELLRANGHKVSAGQILLVAGAMGEPRFELDGTEIRAAYGHTNSAQIPYAERPAPISLYHVTPLSNLASIFEARAGLLPMERQMVHLTEDDDIAATSHRRKGEAAVVLKVDSVRVKGLVHAASSTWLAPKVGADELRVMTVRDIRELRTRVDSV